MTQQIDDKSIIPIEMTDDQIKARIIELANIQLVHGVPELSKNYIVLTLLGRTINDLDDLMAWEHQDCISPPHNDDAVDYLVKVRSIALDGNPEPFDGGVYMEFDLELETQEDQP